MGRIFTWSEVANRQVPTPENFESAIDHLYAWGRSRIDEGTIKGIVHYGSSAGTRNVRSDIDIVLNIAEEKMQNSIKHVNELEQSLGIHNLRLDVVYWPHDRGVVIHPSVLERGMVQQRSRNILLGEDPFSEEGTSTAIDQHQYRSEIGAFVAQRVAYAIKRVPGQSERTRLNILEGLLESVPKLSRMVRIADQSAFGAGESENVRSLHERLPASLLPASEGLIDLDSRYSLLLNQALDGQVSQDEYAAFLTNAEAQGRQASVVLFGGISKQENFDVVLDTSRATPEGGAGLFPIERR